MTTGANPRKRVRYSNEEVQAKLRELYILACEEGRVTLVNDDKSVLLRCPLGQCHGYSSDQESCQSKRMPPQFLLDIAETDEDTGIPSAFSYSEEKIKLLKHVTRMHNDWYRNQCHPSHDSTDYSLSGIGSMREPSCSGTEDGDEEDEQVIQTQKGGDVLIEEEDDIVFEDLDDIINTGNERPSKPCRTAEDVLKYFDTTVGGGCAPGYGSYTDWTVRKVCVGIQELRKDFMLTNTCVQGIISLIALCMGEEDQYKFPPSVHVLDQVMNIADSKEVHICHCSYQYPPSQVDMSDEEKKGETCPHCHLHRYNIVSGRLQPAMRMYYYGVREQIESLFRIHTFRRVRTTGRDESDGIYKSKSITEDLWSNVPEVFESNRSIYSIAIDGAQPFKKRAHSCTKIVMRCEDLPLSHRCKGLYSRTLALIPGPKEPSDHNPYLCVIAREFNELMENGINIKCKNEAGEEEEFIHYPIFRFIYGDAKAMEKTYQYVSCISKIGCRFCTQVASSYSETMKGGKKRTFSRMTGFTQPAKFQDPEPAPEKKEEDSIHMIRSHDALVPRRSREQIWKILHLNKEAIKKKTSGDDPKGLEIQSLTDRYGWKGFPTVFDVGKALDIVDCTPLPIYHLLLLGVVKNFIQYLYDGLKKTGTQNSQNAQGRKMRMVISTKGLEKLEKGIFTNSHVQKPYTRLNLCYSWISEEVGVFLEIYSPFLFDSKILGKRVISEEAEHAWHLLRQAVLYYIGRPTEERLDINTANEKLYLFAKLCEEENIAALIKPNLHTAICRLKEQEKSLGHPKHVGELWMERALRRISSTHTKCFVDETHNRFYRLNEAIERQKYILGICMEQSAIPLYQPRKNLAEKYNTMSDIIGEISIERDNISYNLRFKGEGVEMVHEGSLNTGNNAICKKLGETWMKQRSLPGNSRLSQEEFKFSHAALEYKALVKETADWETLCRVVKSKSKTTERKRTSYLSEVTLRTVDEVTREVTTSIEIAEVDIFFMIARVERSSQGKAINIAGDQQRFALCHLLKTKKENGFYILEYKKWENAYLEKDIIIPVSDIGSLVNGIATTLEPDERGEVIERMVLKPHLTNYLDIYSSD